MAGNQLIDRIGDQLPCRTARAIVLTVTTSAARPATSHNAQIQDRIALPSFRRTLL
jgi:hypothetical protein